MRKYRDLHSLFEMLVRTGTKIERQNWLDMNVEKFTFIKLNDKSIEEIKKYEQFIYAPHSGLLSTKGSI